MDNVISCDWLSFTGHLINHEYSRYYPVSNGKYSTKDETKGTAVYQNLKRYSKNNLSYFVVLYNPRASFLSNYSCQVKLDNHCLYSSELETILKDIFECGITFHCFTRLDLCIDFITFDNNLSPQKFISLVMKNKIFKLRKGDGFSFFKNHHNIEHTGISFGKKSSICHWRLYNKSLELREVKDKYYIREMWAKNNHTEQEGDVWRLEVELKDISTINLGYCGYSNVFDNIFKVITGVHYNFIFNYFLDKTFRFKYNTGQKNISREKDVIFFKTNPVIYHRYKLNGFSRNNKQKIAVSSLIELIGNKYLQDCVSIDIITDSLIALVRRFELDDYLLMKYNIDIDILEKFKYDILEPEKFNYYESL
jgi:hypothetical protein